MNANEIFESPRHDVAIVPICFRHAEEQIFRVHDGKRTEHERFNAVMNRIFRKRFQSAAWMSSIPGFPCDDLVLFIVIEQVTAMNFLPHPHSQH